MNIAEAKQRITIPQLWERLQLPGRPMTSCRCPWRLDRHPSFSVFDNGQKWKDHGTGETGDVIDFFHRVTGLSRHEACRQFLSLTKNCAPVHILCQSIDFSTATPRPFPLFTAGTLQDHLTLASVRSVSLDAVELAVKRGLLCFGYFHHQPAWFVTDSSRRIVQARRMDKMNWWHCGPKALTLPGGQASWPVGASLMTPFPLIIFVEGGPDLLAAFHFLFLIDSVERATAVAMLGASTNIHPDALGLFTRKAVRIVAHLDDPTPQGKRVGMDAAQRWQAQLRSAGANATIYNLQEVIPDSQRVKDLNDATQLPLAQQQDIARHLIG